LRKAFHVGGNSSCQQHLRQHWELYEKKCQENNVPVNHWAIPRHILKKRQAEKTVGPAKQSTILFEKITGPSEFTREGAIEAVAKLITTDDQVRDQLKMILMRLITLPVIGVGQQGCISKLSHCYETQNQWK